MVHKECLDIVFTNDTKISFAPKEWDRAQIEGGAALVVYNSKHVVLVAPIRNFYFYEIYEEGEK